MLVVVVGELVGPCGSDRVGSWWTSEGRTVAVLWS